MTGRMSKSKSNRKSTPQLALPLQRGALADSLEAATRRVAELIHGSRYSREALADEIARLAGRDQITPHQFNAWLTPTNANRMPMDVLIAACHALRDSSPITLLIEPLGLTLAGARDRALAELGDIQLERESLAERERAARQVITHGGNS